ncbi:Npun_F5749 family FMN-dependent PPOX-type flavoprotein [Synechococcus sp. PCC 7336]|uniref:Npun_F5749 family FMN-dependent PPOX-type flavoprotein n=1 Tax=Synechococcus sp. PCC 7336 TaxID=195250 RepID=UPI00034D0724|nr:Npun_F5749 family FMN-dependent PPOX-type flavoprotein [Synechococcus sp. PCC 7336]
MTVSPWKSLLQAAIRRNRSSRAARFLQLATVDAESRPHNRTVVFRGFLPETDLIQLATDRRSEKIEQLQHNPHAAICWYFDKTREQFRLAGAIETVTADTEDDRRQNARYALWSQLSERAKLLWYWPQPKAAREPAIAFLETLPEQSPVPPETFVLLLFRAEEVDRLELLGDPQNRSLLMRTDSGWIEQSVNP